MRTSIIPAVLRMANAETATPLKLVCKLPAPFDFGLPSSETCTAIGTRVTGGAVSTTVVSLFEASTVHDATMGAPLAVGAA